MLESLLKTLRKLYNKFFHSVAFFPAIMGIFFLLLAIFTMKLDEEGVGKKLNEMVTWLTLQDPSTARTIVATATAGIISLTVFSFSMVMIVMNQAASQMSNRMLDNLINNRFQKFVLGFYIGTIIFSLVLLSNISETGDTSIPTLSVYVLILLTILNIFLFVYFLHHITQSFRYEQLIQKIHDRTSKSWSSLLKYDGETKSSEINGEEILSCESGYFQVFEKRRLLEMAKKYDFTIQFIFPEGAYILKGTPFFIMRSKGKIDDNLLKKIFLDIDFYYGQEVDKNPYYGFSHLMEVGIKALSPGINDPGTAVLCLNALTNLLSLKLKDDIPFVFSDDNGVPRIITREKNFSELFEESVIPIWDYGKKDKLVQKAILHMLNQLRYVDTEQKNERIFKDMERMVKKEQQQKEV